MVDIIIIAIVVVLLGFALKGSIKHFKGESPCCGGSSSLIDDAGDKTLEGPVIGSKTLKISGMHCENCAKNVRNALDKIEGVVADVDLEADTARVSYDREINETDLKNAVKAAGYEVVAVI